MGEVVVTGAAGGIGQAVMAALTAAGHQVTGVVRDPARLPAQPGTDQAGAASAAARPRARRVRQL